MKVETIGKLLIAAGTVVWIYAMNMAVTIGNSGIANIHLISERQNMLIFGGILFLAGIILFAVFKLKQTKEDAETADQQRHERTNAVKSFLTESDRGPMSTAVRVALGVVLGGYSAFLLSKLVLFLVSMLIGSFVPAYVEWMVPVVAIVALIAYAFRKISIKKVAIHFACLAILATMSPPLHRALVESAREGCFKIEHRSFFCWQL